MAALDLLEHDAVAHPVLDGHAFDETVVAALVGPGLALPVRSHEGEGAGVFGACVFLLGVSRPARTGRVAEDQRGAPPRVTTTPLGLTKSQERSGRVDAVDACAVQHLEDRRGAERTVKVTPSTRCDRSGLILLVRPASAPVHVPFSIMMVLPSTTAASW